MIRSYWGGVGWIVFVAVLITIPKQPRVEITLCLSQSLGEGTLQERSLVDGGDDSERSSVTPRWLLGGSLQFT